MTVETEVSWVPLLAFVVALASLLVTVVSLGVCILLRVSMLHFEKSIAEMRIQIDDKVVTASNMYLSKVEETQRSFGETVGALREYMNLNVKELTRDLAESEKFNLNTFARRESFQAAISEVKEMVSTTGNELKAMIRDLNQELDRKIEKLQHPDHTVKPRAV